MFGIGLTEFIVLAVILLLLIGPKELPTVMKSVAQFVKQISKARDEFQDTIRHDEDLKNIQDSVHEVKKTVQSHVDGIESKIREDIKKLSDEDKPQT